MLLSYPSNFPPSPAKRMTTQIVKELSKTRADSSHHVMKCSDASGPNLKALLLLLVVLVPGRAGSLFWLL